MAHDEDLISRIAFVDRAEDGSLTLFVADGDGDNRRMVFKSNDPTNKNVLFPRWSHADGTIRVTAMSQGKWHSFFVNPETGVATLGQDAPLLDEVLSRAEGIEVRGVMRYWLARGGIGALRRIWQRDTSTWPLQGSLPRT